MKILALDTASLAASCALLEGERPLGECYTDAKLTHSQTIMPMVEGLLRSTQCSVEEIGLFAVSTGPGSFTGLRIGVAAIKGMAQVLEKPCFALSTLEGLAWNLHDRSGVACPVMDARCGQVYTALFDLDTPTVARLTPDEVLPIPELCRRLAQLERPFFLVGDGYALVQQALAELEPRVTPQLPTPALRMQRAYSVGLAAWHSTGETPTQSGAVLTAGQLVPAYLQLPQAQRELLAKRQAQR